MRESLLLSAGYVTLGVGFGGWVWYSLGSQAGLEYLTGFVVEKSPAMDKVFVIAMILGYFAILGAGIGWSMYKTRAVRPADGAP